MYLGTRYKQYKEGYIN